jgi:hypothetical protein
MPYRQAWETGREHAQKLHREAEIARAIRTARTPRPSRPRNAVASLARGLAHRLGTLADSLDARSAPLIRARPDGA